MMRRYDCITAIAGDIGDALVVAAGIAAREFLAVRPGDGCWRPRTLGLASSIGLGMALSLPNRKVVVLDGDGAFLMNLCGLPTIARQAPPNLIHVLFDNRVYEASGSIPTATSVVGDAVDLAKGAGYPNACWVKNPEEFRAEFVKAWERNQLSFIGARVEPGTPSGLPRISVDEIENKYRFIRHVEATEKKTILGSPDHSRR